MTLPISYIYENRSVTDEIEDTRSFKLVQVFSGKKAVLKIEKSLTASIYP